jgi:hypothetical protein
MYPIFHGYFDRGFFEIKQQEWSPSSPRRVAVVAERSDQEGMSSNVYFVLIGDHMFSATELRRAYHSGNAIFVTANDCLSVSWRDSHHLVLNCLNGRIDSAQIHVRNPRTDDIEITYVNVASSTAAEE